ncbi:MAG: ATP-binding protein [Betaproteobacteria bacterium]
MNAGDEEDAALRSVAMQNAQSILLARQRAEQELVRAKEVLERKTQELAHSLSVMHATLDATWDGILVTDNDWGVTAYNQTYVDMWRIPIEAMASRDHRSLLQINADQFPDSSQFAARVDEINTAGLPESFDLLELGDGRHFERFSKRLLVDDRAVGRVWSFRDITQRRKVEDDNARLYETAMKAAEERKQLLDSERAARSQAERMSEMKDEFLATLSHELRTPLSAILGWSHVLRRGVPSSEDVQKGLEAIERNARVQTQLVEDLLDMSRITSGKVRLDIQPVQPVSFIEAAIETVRPAADAKGIRLEKMLDPLAGPISGDPNRLQQVIWNLLSNAIKFTPKDGKVQVLLEQVRSHIEISVADTGIGIDPGFLQHVFDRFRQADPSTTREYGGLGLGLSIVKHLVELHGGTVRGRSQGDGQGATFTVHLPVAVAHRATGHEPRVHPAAAAGMVLDFQPLDLSGIRVLIVDDEPDSRLLLERVLAECKADVLVAADAETALAAVERDGPHVLVSDIGMPGMDGYELLRRVRALGEAKGGKLPAIALTAFARSEDRTRALRAGFRVHVSKPVEPSELVATIASVVGRTGHQDDS